MRQQQYPGQNQGAEGVDMPERVETDPAEPEGGVVAKPVRDKAVRGLVKGNGDDEREHPDRDVVQ